MTNAAILRLLGGAKVISRPISTDLELVAAVQDGLPPAAADALVASGALTADELYAIVIPRRTLALRKQMGQPLTPDESDRLARVARVLAAAEDVLGGVAKSHRWLRKPNRGVAGQIPLDLLATEAGARVVEQALGRITHGVFA